MAIVLKLENKHVAYGIVGLAALAAIGIYAFKDNPHSAGASSDAVAKLRAAVQAGLINPPGQTTRATPAKQSGLAGVEDMIERLVARAAQKPKDAATWRMLGWSYFATEKYDLAVTAYAKAVALAPNTASLRAMYGEAVVRAADGKVTEQAQGIFKASAALDPKEPRTRFFIGLAKEQAGSKKAALNDWIALLNDAGPTDDWAGELRTRVQELATATGIDIKGRLKLVADKPRGSLGGGMGDAAGGAGSQMSKMRGPTPAQMEAAQSMSETDRTAMINNMVDGLAKRLEANPRDAGGWIRLIRSRQVLGQPIKATAALKRAMQIFKDAPMMQMKISSAARQMGVSR